MNQDNHPHTLHVVDSHLDQLNHLILEMMQLVKNQLLIAMRAVAEVDAAMALSVIQFDREVLNFEHEVDAEALIALARYSPVATDLRTVIASLKVATELQNIDHEVTGFARLAAKVFDPSIAVPNAKILADLVKLGDLVKYMLCEMLIALQQQNTRGLYPLLELDTQCEEELQDGIKHQLEFVLRENRKIKGSLDLLLMMKALQHCGEHCKNLTEYLIYMLDGVDVRHQSRQRAA